MKILIAWLVHLFTASGLLAGFMSLLAVIEGDYRMAMLWMLATIVIDGVDGTFARMAKVKEVLPNFSGKTLDYVIDFFTYAILPAFFFYVTSDAPYWPKLLCCFAILMSAALYYSQGSMVTKDGKHFIGFPVLWNMVVYIFVFVTPGLDVGVTYIIVILLCILHFVPILVPYPSQDGHSRGFTITAVIVFIGSAIVNVWSYPEPVTWARWACIVSSLYFALITILDTFRARRALQHQN